MRAWLRAGLAMVTLGLGCAPPPTQLVVVVDTDLDVPAEIDGVRITVTRPDASRETESLDLEDRSALPLTLAVIADGDALGPIDVVAEGLLDGATVLSRAARATLVRGESRMLVMHLVRSCVGRTCVPATLSCSEDGCVGREVRDLPPWTGTPPGLDAGVPDAPQRDAPGIDAPDAPIGCMDDEDCDDGVACTHDSCGAGGFCASSSDDSLCDDGNPCTDDACGASGCMAVNNTAPCDDGVFCNGVDVCAGGACTHPGDPCPSPTVCDATSGVCRGCTLRSHCPADVTGAWTSCDFADGCDESGTRSRTDVTYDCIGGNCMATPNVVNDTCARETDGMGCGVGGCGGFGACGGFSDTCDESGEATQTCTDLVCRSGTCRSEMRTNSTPCGRSTGSIVCGGETCGDYGSCDYSDGCDESATQFRTCTTPLCAGGTCSGSMMRMDPGGCSRETDGMSCGAGLACAAGGCVSCSRTLSGAVGTVGPSYFLVVSGSGNTLTFHDASASPGNITASGVTFSGSISLPIAVWQVYGEGSQLRFVDWNGADMGTIAVSGANVSGSFVPPTVCDPTYGFCFPAYLQRVEGVAGGLQLTASDGTTGSISFACP